MFVFIASLDTENKLLKFHSYVYENKMIPPPVIILHSVSLYTRICKICVSLQLACKSPQACSFTSESSFMMRLFDCVTCCRRSENSFEIPCYSSEHKS